MKLLSMKWLQVSLAVIAVLALIIAGCGGGGGGGSSEPIKVRTLSGTVYAPVAPPASLQPSIGSGSQLLSGSLLAAGGSPVANAKVWLEGYRDVPAQYTDASGTYKFIGVTADEHFVVSSFEYLGKTYKQRVRALVQGSDVDVIVPLLSLEEATKTLTGVLKDSAGNVLPAGTEMMLWGEVFTIGSNGSFSTPALPTSISQAQLFVKLPGATAFTGFYGPFTGGSTPAFIEQTVLPPDSGNRAPSGVLLARNTAGIETVKCVTGEQLNLSLTSYDPDTGHLERLKYVWTASRGTLQVTGNQTTATWLAMESYGLATITVAITDPEGVTARVSLRILVNIQSPDETDTTPPTVVSRTPAANTVGVTPDSSISVVFSEELLGTSVTAGAINVSSQDSAVSGASALQADKKTIVWTPTTVLPGNKTITVSLLPSISDLFGNQLGEQSSWSFSTTLVPGITVNSLYTNDNTPEITGTVDDPEATVSVTVNSRSYNAILDGTVWRVQVTDTLPDGVYNVSAVATNKSGVSGSDSSSNELTIDTRAETAVLSTLPPVITGSGQISITVGGTGVVRYIYRLRLLGDPWGDWSAEIPVSEKISRTALADGMHNLQVRAVDAAGNIQAEADATYYEWTVDKTAKIAQLATATLPLDPTNQTSINVTVVGSGVQLYRFNLNEGSWSGSFPVTTPISLIGLKSGTNVLRVIGGDSDGNWQPVDAPTTYTWVIDANVKVAVLLEKPLNPTNLDSASIKVGGTGVTKYKYSTNGGATWTAEILISATDTITLNGLADGSYSIRVIGGDDLGTWQANTNASIWNWVVDTKRPTVALTCDARANKSPVAVRIEFSEPVTGFSAAKLTVGNGGTVSSLQPITLDQVWIANITPAATGTVTVTVATEAVDLTDAAGNKNDGATVEFEFDSVNPTIILSTGEKEPTNNQAFTMTISFNKKISGFELNDLQVANGSASGLQVSPGDDTVWTATITAAGPGEVKAEIAANRLFDLFGNGNEPSNPLIRNYDPASPTVVISTGVVSPTKTKPVPITIKFSEKVKNFVDGDLTLTNCSVSNFVTSDNITWTADLDPGEGEAKIELDAAVAEDDAGNGNQAAVPLTVKYDSIPPTVSMTSLSDGQTVNDSPVLVTITFSEPVVGFNLGLLSPSNATAGNLQVVETDRIWTFEVTPKLKGLVTIDFAAGIIQDQAGHNNEASNQISFTYDSDRPTVTLTLGEGVSNPTSQALIPVTIEFSKPVVGFALDKLSTDNCTVQDLAVVEADENWTFNLKPTALGQVSVILEANKVTDAAGNGNTAAVRLRVYYDNVPPAVTLSSTASPTTNVSPIPLRITFTEVVQGFTKDALTVTNGAVSGDLRVITANKIWDADIVPNVGKDEVTVELPANIVKDTAGNDNTAAVALSRNYDSVAPELIVFDAVGVPDPTNLVAVTATIEFDEDVNGFDLSCLTVSNCSLSDLVTKTAKRKWEFKVTPGADDTVTGMLPVTVDLIANKVFDAAGNGNSASGFSRTFDRTRPLVYLSKKDGFSEPTNSKPFVIRIDFNEAINDLTIAAFDVSNGSVNSVTRVSENYRRWEAEISPTSDGTTGIRLKAGAASDSAGNTNLESEVLNVIYDGTRPGVSLISRATANPTNEYPIPITIEFTEPVSGFNISHLVVTGGGAENLTGPDGNKWYADIKPTVQGAILINLPEGSAVDSAGNSNTAAAQLTVNYSSVRPTVVISSSESNPTNTNPIPVTVEFSDSVNGFEVGDLQIANASPANFNNVDDQTYTLTLTPQSNGLITVDVPAGVAENSGNTNTAATQFRITFDSIQPTAVLTTNSQSPTSNSSIPATITFSEKIKSFALTDLTRGNCDLDSLVEVVASRTWSFNIKPTPAAPPASVAVSLKLDAGKVEDLAGNTNPVSNEIKLVYDDSKPEPVLASTAPEPTNIKHIPVTLTFDRAVSGFALTDLVIVNGLAGNLQELVIGKQWSFTVNAGLEGAVTVDLPANRVLDAAGNGNATATQLLRTYNATRPGVVLTSSVTGPTNADTIPLTITFDKDISYFDLAYLVVDGGDKGNLLASSPVNRVWTASITPTITNGNITISLPANVATDSANNFNTAAVPLTIAYDKQSPTVTLTATPTAAIGQTPFDVTITFSEEVSGFLIDHIAVVNGTKGAALTTKTANRIWTLRVTPDSTGDVTIDIPANSAIKDLVGNELAQPATQLVVVCDMSPLTATIATSTEVLSPTKVTPIPLVVTFNKSIQNLFLSNLSVTNATVSGLSQVPGEDGKKWSFNLTPSINTGTASVILPANRVKDLAGNFNETSNLFEIYYDRVQPAAVLSSTASATTNLDPIPVTITFNEPVRDFVIGDLVVGNGSAGNLQPDPAPGLNNVWTVDITPTADGTVTVDLPKDKAEDAAGNLNTAAAQLVRTSDRISPTVTLTTTAPLDPNSTNINPIPVTIDFSEPVVGFDISKLTLSNATAGNWQPLLPSGQRWSVNISPAGSNVVVTVDVNANVASDSANNGNDAANQLKINYNSVRPTVTLSSAAPDPTNTSPIPFQIDFGKPVTSFSLTDLTIGNGIAGNLATLTASLSYSFDVAPGSDGNVTVDMAADKVKDDAGNWNDAAVQISRIYDTTGPTVATITSSTPFTNGTPFTATLVFNEAVNALTITVASGTAGAASMVDGDRKIWEVTITPTADPEVSVWVKSGDVIDLANNPSTQDSGKLFVGYDNLGPTVELLTNVTGPTNLNFIPTTVVFSEAVTGFKATDLDVGNATITELTDIGAGERYSVTLKPDGGTPVTMDLPPNRVTDLAGNFNAQAAPTISIAYDNVKPTVQNVWSSSPDGVYTMTQTIDILVGFDEIVYVTGTPRLTLETGTTDRTADYVEGSESTTLTFRYTVQSGDMSPRLDYVSVNALSLNGGSIRDEATNDAILTLPATGTANSLAGNSAIEVDFRGPRVLNVTSIYGDTTYTTRDNIEIQVEFNRAAVVTGMPQLTLETGAVDRVATYTGGSGDTVLNFIYTVQTGDTSLDLDYVNTTSLALNGGTIRDTFGSDAVLTLPAPGTGVVGSGSLGVNKNIVIDTSGPGVTDVTSTTANGTYTIGKRIEVVVTFARPVTVTGTPRLTLAAGPVNRLVNYKDGSTTSTLTFEYVVQAGDNTNDLDYTNTAALILNGGTIRDELGNNAVLTLPAPGVAGSLGFNKNIAIDTLGPTITNVTSTTPDGQYGVPGPVNVQVQFSKPVTVSMSMAPRIRMNCGTNASATYDAGSGSNTLNFSYVIRTGDQATKLDVLNTGAFDLNNSAIEDSLGNPAVLTLPAPGTAGSLSVNKNIKIYTGP